MARDRKQAGKGKPSGFDRKALTHRRVGRPLQARLIGLEIKIGLFSEEQDFDADSRFHHPVILPASVGIPAAMGEVFREDLSVLERLGRRADACHKVDFPPYQVFCLSFFFYDGFRALVHVEKEGDFVAAWKEEEVEQPDSPRFLISGKDLRDVEAFLTESGNA